MKLWYLNFWFTESSCEFNSVCISVRLSFYNALFLESTDWFLNTTQKLLLLLLLLLNKQQLLLSHILKVCPVKVINMWQALAKRLPSNIFNFIEFFYLTMFYLANIFNCRKALILFLPNKSNLYRWKIINAFFAIICKHNFMCCQIVKNAWIDTLGDTILC